MDDKLMKEKAEDFASLMKEATKEGDIPYKKRTESERVVICYNPRCTNYRKVRDYDVACGCKRTSIKKSDVGHTSVTF